MESLLGEQGSYIDAIYYCPHHPDKGFEGEISSLKFDCNCRKPKPGLIYKASSDFNIDLEQSWMIGDGLRDIAAGQAAGTHTALLSDARVEKTNLKDCEQHADIVASDLLTAVRRIIWFS